MRHLDATEELWAPVTYDGASEQIVRRLGEAMGAGILRAGDGLPSEAELASRFRVSAMTVRKALSVLRDEGYIETRRGRDGGSYIADDIQTRIAAVASRTEFTVDQLRELTDWRRAVSGEAAALAAVRRAESDLEEIGKSMGAARVTTSDAVSFRMNDARFHVLIAELSRSRRLLAAETEIQEELTRLIIPLPGVNMVRKSSHGGHIPMVDSIRECSPEAARSSVIQHVESTYDWLIGLHLGQAPARGRD